MKRLHLVICQFAIIATTAGAAFADGLLYKLPADGTSATYELVGSMWRADREHQEEAELTLRSVGRTNADGEPGRWLEMVLHPKGEAESRVVVFKVHIPEKYLTRGKRPADHITEAWIRVGAREAKKIGDTKARELTPIAGFLTGPFQEPSELSPVEVESAIGTLRCKGEKGVVTVKDGRSSHRLSFAVRLNDSAPFGVVSGTIDGERTIGGEVAERSEFKFKLIRVETGATAAIK
jgi:hypothetical protein